MDFKAFPKIPRLSKSFFVTITEKLDGSNGQVQIVDYDWHVFSDTTDNIIATGECPKDGRTLGLIVGSRSRWIKPGKETDNYGFARWCVENKDDLFKLGQGQHFGEWYGNGIQCGYGLSEKRFALFNARRWTNAHAAMKEGHLDAFPTCCEVVPVLYQGAFSSEAVKGCMDRLEVLGSVHVPGFMRPEGVVVEMNGELAKHTFQHTHGKWLDAA